MMATTIIAHNDLVKDRAEVLVNFLRVDTSLRLFANDFQPDIADTLAAFDECGFPGYARKNMAAQWDPVFKVVDGQYQFQSKLLVFQSTGPSNEKAYGWFIVASGKVRLSCRLAGPTLMTTGKTLTVRADVSTWASTLL